LTKLPAAAKSWRRRGRGGNCCIIKFVVNSKQQVINLIVKNKQAFRSLGAKKVGLFGSFARGEQTRESDVDLLVDFLPEQKSYRNFLNVADLAERLLNRKVEVLTPQSLSPYLAPYIEKDVTYVQTG